MDHHPLQPSADPQPARAGARLWWSALGVVAAAALLVVVGTSVADAFGHGTSVAASTAPPVAASTAPPVTAPTGGTSGAAHAAQGVDPPGGSPSSMSNMGGARTSPAICPNVQGATVMANGMVMAPVPSTPPTAAQQAAANTLVSQVDRGIAAYENVAVAEADGYRPISGRRGLMTHYLNPSVIRSGDVLDPSRPSALMFANSVDGPVLVGAMFLGPAPCQPGPDVGGSLTQWHAHDNLCFSGGQLVGRTTSTGTCTTGQHRDTTYFMLHVWTAPQLAAQYQFQVDLPAAGNAVIDQIDRTGQA